MAHAGLSCDLNEYQKVLKYYNVFHNNAAIRYHIDAKNERYVLPLPKQAFDKFYNMFSANFIKFNFLIGGTSEDYYKNKTLWINAVGT